MRAETAKRSHRAWGAFSLAVAVALIAGAPPVRAQTGSIAGTVRLMGEAPENEIIALAPDHHCVKLAGGPLRQLDVVVGEEGGLANVLVRLRGQGLAAAAGPVPEEPLVIEQRACLYLPRVSGMRADQTLRVVNRDAEFHNVRSMSELGTDFNISQPFADMEYDFEAFAEQEMMRLRCDAHPWMRAFVGIVEHPWFAVTGEDGRFEIAGVPPGTYDLSLWHEVFGTVERTVTVEAGGTAAVQHDFQAADGS